MGKIWTKLTTTVAGGAMIIAAASLLSRLVGIVRESLLFSTYGAGDVLDAYYAAFKLPDLLFNIVVLGALSSSFVPIFVSTWQKDPARSFRVANTVLNDIIVVLIVLCVGMGVFADSVARFIAPGFTGEKMQLTVDLMRVMLVGVVFFGISNIASGILNSFKRFLAYGLAPIFYNVGIIIGILFLVPRYGPLGLGYGVVLGSILHSVVQVPSLIQVGYRYRWLFENRLKEVRDILRLLGPRTLGLAAAQVNLIVITNIASLLPVGSVAVFNAANNLQYVPVSLFGISLAIASFPVFSEAYAKKDTAKFIESVSNSMRRILFLTIPVSVGIILLRAQIVRVVLGHGNFDWEDTVLISQALGFFAISLFAQSIIPLLARSFYARHDTKTPVIISLFSVALNVVGSLTLPNLVINGEPLGIVGLVLAFSLANLINMVWLFAALHVQLGNLDDHRMMLSLTKIVVATFIMAIVVQVAKYTVAPIVNMQTTVGVATQAAGATIAGIGVYFLLAIWLHSEEIDIIRKKVTRIFGVLRS